MAATRLTLTVADAPRGWKITSPAFPSIALAILTTKIPMRAKQCNSKAKALPAAGKPSRAKHQVHYGYLRLEPPQMALVVANPWTYQYRWDS